MNISSLRLFVAIVQGADAVIDDAVIDMYDCRLCGALHRASWTCAEPDHGVQTGLTCIKCPSWQCQKCAWVGNRARCPRHCWNSRGTSRPSGWKCSNPDTKDDHGWQHADTCATAMCKAWRCQNCGRVGEGDSCPGLEGSVFDPQLGGRCSGSRPVVIDLRGLCVVIALIITCGVAVILVLQSRFSRVSQALIVIFCVLVALLIIWCGGFLTRKDCCWFRLTLTECQWGLIFRGTCRWR